MKYLVLAMLLVLMLSCGAHTEINQQAAIPFGSFERECHDEVMIQILELSPCEKELAEYFTARLYDTYSELEWWSCNKKLNNDQKAYMAEWWGVQGILQTPKDVRKASCFVLPLLVGMGTPKEEAIEFFYAVTYKNIYDKYNLDMCAYNKSIHKF